MRRLSEWPRILLRKWLVFALIGAACLITGIIMLLVTHDTMLMIMSGILAVMTALRCVFLYRRIGSGNYMTFEGICTRTDWLPFQRLRRICVLLDNGEERSFYSDHRFKPSVGNACRFYIIADELYEYPRDSNRWLAPETFAAEVIEPASE